MDSEQRLSNKNVAIGHAIEAAIRIGILLLLVYWCFDIVRPFLVMIVWGIIIAVAVYPVYKSASLHLPGAEKTAAVLCVVLLTAIILVPTLILSSSAITAATDLAKQLNSGVLHIPPPPEQVANWPLIGARVSALWTLASENIAAALTQIQPQLRATGLWLLTSARSVGAGLLQFVGAIVIAGFFLLYAGAGRNISLRFSKKVLADKGEHYVELAAKLIRSVTLGILGVAMLQALLAGMGFIFMDIPGAGLWSILVLLLAVIQIGPGPVMIGVAIYVFNTAELIPAIIYLGWSIAVGLVDNILKPLLLGRGVDVPMAVVFIGAIGGFLSMGIIGLFLGSVILALSYSLLIMWLDEPD